MDMDMDTDMDTDTPMDMYIRIQRHLFSQLWNKLPEPISSLLFPCLTALRP
jgi:hypothetical protein